MKKYLGLGLVVVGVLLLVVLKVVRLTFVNTLLLAPLFIIIIGVVLYVWAMKKENLY